MNWNILPSDEVINNVAEKLTANGFATKIVENGKEALDEALKLIPEGSEVQANTSATADAIGLSDIIDNSGKYDSVRKKVTAENDAVKRAELRRKSSAPDYSTGSVHAVTQNGQLVIASRSGSQLASESYGANHVIFIIGTQKIVDNLDAGFKRIYEYTLPLESERLKKLYGIESEVRKMLILNKEEPGRINVILVKEVLGF